MIEVSLIGHHKVNGIFVDKKKFIVLKGSEFSQEVKKSCPMGIREIRDNLIKTKKVENGIFVEDVIFTSPSYAASVCVGRTGNGLKCWENVDNVRLGSLLEQYRRK